MTREEMWKEFEKQLIRETRTPITVSYNVSEKMTKSAIERTVAKWKERLEQEPRWIPVSERLPEEREWIGTKRFGTTISDEVYVTLETSDGERFTKHLFFQNGELSQIDQEHMRVWFKEAVPIAWMPLPKPYSEVEE